MHRQDSAHSRLVTDWGRTGLIRLVGALFLALFALPSWALTLSPHGLVEKTLTPGGEVSQTFFATLGAGETLQGWDFTGQGTFTDHGLQGEYRFTDPGDLQHCDMVDGPVKGIAAGIDVNGLFGGESPVTDGALISIRYLDPLSLADPGASLSGPPGATVSFTTSFSGGRAPFSATVSLPGATTSISGTQLTYTYQIPLDATAGTLSDRVTLSGQSTVCGGDSASIAVSIQVLPGLSVSPSALSLAGAPGTQVTGQLQVSGGAVPYSAAAERGQVSVNGGVVDYSYDIPAGATGPLSDRIRVTDYYGSVIAVPVTIDVTPLPDPLAVSPAQLVLTGEAGTRVTGQLQVSGGIPPYGAAARSGQVSVSGDVVHYSYDIPPGATGRLSDSIRVTDDDGAAVDVPVTIDVAPPPADLVVSPAQLTLTGDPGTRVTGQLQVSGGVLPYSARAETGQVSVNGMAVNYSYNIPGGAIGSLSDRVTVSDAQGVSRIVPVTIVVRAQIGVSPSPLELSSLSLVGVEGKASKSFEVSGGTPPYSLAVASGGSGRVDPARLDAPGSATYSVAIPANSTATTISDQVLITDAGGLQVKLPVSVDVAASDTLSSQPGLTPNEQNVAQAIETVCPQLSLMTNRTADQEDLFQQCSQMLENASSSGIPNTLNEVTTEKARAATSAAVETGNQQLSNIGSRLAALRGGATGLSLRGLSFNVDGQPMPVEQIAGAATSALTGGAASGDSSFGRWGFFLNGAFNFGNKDTTINETGFDFSTAGVTAGADYRFTDKLIAGGAIGYGNSDVSFDSNGGGLDTQTWTLAAYGTYNWTDRAYVDAIVEYGWHSYDSTRNISYQVASTTSPVNRRANADYDGSQFGASIGAGYDFDNGPLSYGVYGRAGYIQVDVNGYRETGAGGLNLQLDGFDSTSVTTTLGARISRVFNTSTAVLVPQARVEWEHEYDDDASSLVARFAADPTAVAFGIETDSPDSDYFRLGLGLSAVFPHGLSTFFNYEALLDKSDWTDNLIDAGMRWEFY